MVQRTVVPTADKRLVRIDLTVGAEQSKHSAAMTIVKRVE
jgi:hypothetical protein